MAIYQLTCEGCGATFARDHNRQRFCSPRCSQQRPTTIRVFICEGCQAVVADHKHPARRFCSRACARTKHHRRMRDQAERFWEKVVHGPIPTPRPDLGPCWVWTGVTNNKGYGTFSLGRRGDGRMTTHRWAYESLIGVVPDAMVLDHLCRNTLCVHPLHVEPVTQRTNLLRGEGVGAREARQTHCAKGHPFDEHNTRHRRNRIGRICRACDLARKREAYRAVRHHG